ncbi:MAG: hypothetical protein M1820_000775 [Bogoriella megaspora]|nr:MAG: hypothetical protein M1820_000775 [Bogoriella megaspora]
MAVPMVLKLLAISSIEHKESIYDFEAEFITEEYSRDSLNIFVVLPIGNHFSTDCVIATSSYIHVSKGYPDHQFELDTN